MHRCRGRASWAESNRIELLSAPALPSAVIYAAAATSTDSDLKDTAASALFCTGSSAEAVMTRARNLGSACFRSLCRLLLTTCTAQSC